eukprot:834520-Prymnesium_polylepis.1
MQFPTPEPPMDVDPFETVFVGIIRDYVLIKTEPASHLFLAPSPTISAAAALHTSVSHLRPGPVAVRVSRRRRPAAADVNHLRWRSPPAYSNNRSNGRSRRHRPPLVRLGGGDARLCARRPLV